MTDEVGGTTPESPSSEERTQQVGYVAPKRRLRERIPAPVRYPVVIFLLALIVEYLVIPRFVIASHSLNAFRHLNPYWLSAGVLAEAAALFAYSLLTKVLLPPSGPGIGRLWRIDLAGLAIAHVVPGGTAGSATLGYRLLTSNGVSGKDAGFAMATQGMGSAVVLNILLWFALVVSIPFAGVHTGYVLVALLGMFVLLGFGALVFFFTRGEESAVRLVRTLGRKLPRVSPDQLENVVRHIGQALRDLARDRERLKLAAMWAAVNWLLDATSLWCFLASLGVYVNPVYLFVGYGVGNVLAAIPITPAGLGFIESAVPLMLSSFGYPGGIATLAVIGWRFVNFWLPIPVGAGAYISLRVGRGSNFASRRQALRRMAEESRNRSEPIDSEDRRPRTAS
jgi:uncharacterized protein (TIRG00374 family)